MMRAITLAAVLAATIAIPALAQDAPRPPAAATLPSPVVMKLTADQAKSWIDKRVYSSDAKNIGEVAAFARGTDDTVIEMHIDIGGFLGLGQTRVRLMPAQFRLDSDRVLLELSSTQVKDLPRVK